MEIDKLEPNPSPGEQAGQIIFDSVKDRMAKARAAKLKKQIIDQRINEKMPPSIHDAVEAAQAKETNRVARANIEDQISQKMKALNVLVRSNNEDIKTGLDLLEMARCAVYTEPLSEVLEMFSEAAWKLRPHFPDESQGLANLGAVVQEIIDSEVKKND